MSLVLNLRSRFLLLSYSSPLHFLIVIFTVFPPPLCLRRQVFLVATAFASCWSCVLRKGTHSTRFLSCETETYRNVDISLQSFCAVRRWCLSMPAIQKKPQRLKPKLNWSSPSISEVRDTSYGSAHGFLSSYFLFVLFSMRVIRGETRVAVA